MVFEYEFFLDRRALARTRGLFIYYVITFLGFLDSPPPLRQHVFSTKNKQKLVFSEPPPSPLPVLTQYMNGTQES